MNIQYQLESELENTKLINELSELYSNHYGYWGATAKNAGNRISLSETRIRSWTNSEVSYIATARDNNKLIGYAIAVSSFKNKKEKTNKISWITQLVVHENYRRHGVGKKLVFSFWGFSNHYAWGIMSSNPYAIRALEKATYRRVNPHILKSKQAIIKKFGIENVSYLDEYTEFVIEENNCKVNTKFPSDISKVKEKLKNVTEKGVPWLLGEINEGWEWLAFTLNDQDKISLTKEEIDEMLDLSDVVAREAYSRMLMNSDNHKWASHTKMEVDFIVKHCLLDKESKVADFGCGIGRHTNELYSRGYDIVGIDYSKNLLSVAKKDNNIFTLGDCRSINLEKKYDSIVCLYDVIGSFIDNKENIKILKNISKHLKIGGYTVISVMNMELTRAIAKHKFNLETEYNKLLELASSDTMETTGQVFNPDYYMMDEKTSIVYRREQFTSGDKLHQELIVRDYRYTQNQIKTMCIDVGFEILSSSFVQAGNWSNKLNATDLKAKEILLVCRKLN